MTTTTTGGEEATGRRMTYREYMIKLGERYRELVDTNDRTEFFERLVEEAPAYILREMARESLNLNWNMLFKPPKERERRQPTPNPIVKAATIVKKIAEIAAEKAVTNFLGQDTALGKPLGECTGEEVGRLSGWHKKLAAGMKPNQKVKNAYNENQVARLLLS